MIADNGSFSHRYFFGLGVQKTAVAGSALATQGKMLASAMDAIKEKLSSLGDMDLSEKFADMGETAAAKAFVNIAEQLKTKE